MTVLLSIFLLSVLVFIHEAAHLIAARALRAPVAEFSIGFGPEFISFRLPDRLPLGGILFTLRWIPLGGFVRFAQPDDVAVSADSPRRPWWRAADPLSAIRPFARFIICIAGPIGSMIGMALFFAVALRIWGEPPRTQIGGFNPVASALFEPSFAAALEATQNPQATALSLAQGSSPTPLASPAAQWTRLSTAEALTKSVRATHQAITLIGEMTWWLITNPDILYDNLGGPVGIVDNGARIVAASSPSSSKSRADASVDKPTRGIEESIDSASRGQGWNAPMLVETRGYALLILYMGVLSVFLAFINLLPLPPFDGYHAAMSLLELLIHRPIPAKLRAGLALAGTVVFLGLLARGTANDIERIRTYEARTTEGSR